MTGVLALAGLGIMAMGAWVLLQAEKGIAALGGLLIVAVGMALAGSSLYYGPKYTVWQQGLAGQAVLERARQDRQVAIQEAEARYESAKLDAEAEVVKATGSAKANEILTKSLSSTYADKYLQLRYIQVLENSAPNREVIYVPNGPLPIPEAGRAVMPSSGN